MERSNNQIQIRFVTKQPQYAVPDTPFAVPLSVTTTELNNLVNELLKEANITDEKVVEFDLLVDGEYLKTDIEEHLRSKEISTESVIEVEYVERLPAPEPEDCLLHDDWVSAVDTLGKWILTGCYDNSIQLWSTHGIHKLTIPGHTAPIKAVSWVKQDEQTATFVSGSHDQTAMLWEWKMENNTVECIAVYKGHERNIESVKVDPDGHMFASGGWDTMLKVWSADVDDSHTDMTGQTRAKRSRIDSKSLTRTPLMTLKGHKDCISCVSWSDNNEILTCSWDHTIKLWDSELGGIKQELVGNKSFFHSDYSSLNKTIVTSSADRHIRIYDPRSNEGSIVKCTLTSHSMWVQSVKWSKTEEDLFISGSYDNIVKLWDRRSPRAALYDLTGHEDKVLCCDWSEPKLIISGGADNTLRIYKSKHALRKLG